MKIWINILGWTGSGAVVGAYGLNSYHVLTSDSFLYLFLNLTGGIFLIIYSIFYRAYANTFINVVWVLIAVVAIVTRFLD